MSAAVRLKTVEIFPKPTSRPQLKTLWIHGRAIELQPWMVDEAMTLAAAVWTGREPDLAEVYLILTMDGDQDVRAERQMVAACLTKLVAAVAKFQWPILKKRILLQLIIRDTSRQCQIQ